GRRDELQAVARRLPQPARDREDASGLQVPQVVGGRVDRVEVRVCKGLHAGARRGERIQQRNLYEVPARRGARDETARLRDVNGDARVRVDAARELAVSVAYEGNHLRVELDGVDVLRAQRERHQHVRAAAGAEHQHARALEQAIRQGGGDVGEMAG